MVKRLSKLFLLVFVLLFIFAISGCTNNQGDGQEYSIIYINGSTVVDLEPRTYISGEVTKLPSLGEDFIGWYTNKELSGNPVNEIKANSTGNLIFYTNYNLEKDVFYLVVFKDYDNKVLKEEKVKENGSATAPSAPTREGYEFIGWSEDFSNVTSDLTVVALYKELEKDLLVYFKNVFENCGNFKLDYKCTDNEEYNSNETYLYSKNGVAYAYQDWYDNLYVDYYYKDVNGLMAYLVDNGDGTYEKFVEGSEVFDIMQEYFYTIKYTEISNEDFTYSDNCYNAKEEKVNELAKLLIGAYPDETFTSLKVYVEGDYINKIVARSEIVYDGEKYPYDYEITFSNFNNVSVSLPDEGKVKEAISISTQSNTYTVSKGTNFDDVLTDVSIILTYSNGTTEVLPNDYCTFTHEYNKDVLGTYEVIVKYYDLAYTFNVVVTETVENNTSIKEYFENIFKDCGNFEIEYKYTEEKTYENVETFYFTENAIKFDLETWDGERYTDYVYTDTNGLKVYLYDQGDGLYEKHIEGSKGFDEIYPSIYNPDYEEIIEEDFTYSNNCFTAKADKADALARLLVGDYESETYSSLKIYVEGDYISKIVASSEMLYEGETYAYDYEITFSNFNNVTVTLPDVNLVLEIVSISTESNTYTVSKGTNFEDALNEVTILINYSDGSSEVITTDICTFTSEYNKDVAGTYEITVEFIDYTCKFNIVVEEEQQVSKTIEEYVNAMTNFQYVYSYVDSDVNVSDYSSTNYYNNGIYKFEVIDEGETYYDYVYYEEDGSIVYLYDNGDGTYEAIYEDDSYFDDYYYYVDVVDLSGLNSNDFTFSNNCFVAKASVVDDSAFNAIGGFEGEIYTSFKIYVNETYITKIEAISEYIYGSKTYTCSYQVVFSNIGTTNITLPDEDNTTDAVQAVGITTSATNVNVVRGTSFETVLEKINISLVYNDNTTVTLDKDLCTFTHQYSPSTLGSYDVQVTYESFECTFKVNVLEEVDVYEVLDDTVVILEDILDDMFEYEGEVYGVTVGLTDNSNVLVIPIEFTDYKADSQMQTVLEKAFFGTSEETGWESLKSYYYKSSYGKCNITGTVLPVFSTGYTSRQFDSLDPEESVDGIVKAALEYYDSSVNYDDYDANGDACIDAIYLIYTAPVVYEDDDSIYWAFSSQYYTDDHEYYDNVEANFYCFMGYDFIFETLANGTNITYNAETIIHESGHIFGLDDYYDYDSSYGPKGGIGGGDMMDYNVGDHNAFSKLILGWADPKVIDAANINSDIVVDLKSFGQTGECLLIVNGWEKSYFDEYFIIDFYTPDGLNELEAGYDGLFSVSGIRIYHIDARLNTPDKVYSVWEVYQFNNANTSHKLIQLIQADGLNEIENTNELSDNEDLFQVNDKFTNITWYDNSNCKFEIVVNSITEDNAQITIKYIG